LSEHPEQQKNGLEVSLGLLSGDEEHGRLIRFSPLMRTLHLQVGPDRVEHFDVPEVAYIGFHRAEGTLPSLPALEGMEVMIVHTVTGKQFRVQMVESKTHKEGFYAFIESEDSQFDHLFFYNHGVRIFEQPKAIGQVLIDEKAASPREVRKALSEQQTLKKQPLGGVLVAQQKVESADIEEALARQRRKPKKIGDILIEAGLIKDDDLQKALVEQSKNRELKVGQVLIEMGVVTEEELISALAKKFHMPFVDLNDYTINPMVVEEIDSDILLRFQVLPIASDEHTLTLAASDPLDIEGFDTIRFQTKKRISEVLASPSQIGKLLKRELAAGSGGEEDWLWIERVGGEKEEALENEVVEVKAAEAPPIVRLTNKILINGICKGASDIHVLPQAHKVLVLYRINGDLQQELELEKWVQRRMISRIKLLSGMNITDHRVTQDGHMMVRYEGGVMEFRVSCIPNAFGESIVMRILNKEMAVDLETLGLSEKDHHSLALLARKPFGLILATGPTGSGKSTTLFALLQGMIHLPLHIITIEDPVESEIKGTNQIQVNTKVGLTFASVLRNVLRHDPDVIMVGEMRDQETASIGIEAALTGHLMLSTLHTNSAVDTIIRLQDLGIPNYLLAPALRGIISQSLLKRLCEQCRQPLDDEDDEVYQLLEDMGLERPKTLYQPGQCDSCNQSGFSGRVMAYEFLEVTEPVRQAIHDGKIGHELQEVAEKDGMISKARHALSLAESGVICRDDLVKLLI
jgi:type II secretory ATPase GspE/PulE/Tfp pilus assembly ATPase PilB-like protein